MPLEAVSRRLCGASYVLFGFGDRRYLMTRDQGSCTGVAALWAGPELIRVTGLTAPQAAAVGADHTTRITATEAQARAAEEFIWGSMRQGDNPAEPVATGAYDGSVYCAARSTQRCPRAMVRRRGAERVNGNMPPCVADRR